MHAIATTPVQVSTTVQSRALPAAVDLPPFDPSLLERHRPDEHWALLEGDMVTARCSLWWSDTPSLSERRVGMIGHYAANSSGAARSLLDHACTQLADAGCLLAVGPADGSTWRDYRFITQRGTRPPFFLEPVMPDEGQQQFLENGFVELAGYFSAIAEDLSRRDPRIGRARSRLFESGVRIRHLCEEQFESDLRQIYRVVNEAFQDHLLFAPVGEVEFLAHFHALRESVPNELVLIAEERGQIVGFCFGVPDLRQAERGLRIDTAILKTFGVLPGRRFAGLGQVLLEEFHQQAQFLGFSRVIHALVRETGHMQRMSERYGVAFRRYAFYVRELSL